MDDPAHPLGTKPYATARQLFELGFSRMRDASATQTLSRALRHRDRIASLATSWGMFFALSTSGVNTPKNRWKRDSARSSCGTAVARYIDKRASVEGEECGTS